jgi:hypothetical protein
MKKQKQKDYFPAKQGPSIDIRCRWCNMPGVIGGDNHAECVNMERMAKGRKPKEYEQT